MRQKVMADKMGLLEKESVSVIEEKPSVCAGRSSINQVSAADVEPSLMDDILEDALFGNRPVEHLTKREAEILKLIVRGNTNKKIAQKLYRAERTVEYHRNRLMRKLGAHNAADLVKRAIAMGVV
jgi:DNA-binding NarL/FixJ family response regulator